MDESKNMNKYTLSFNGDLEQKYLVYYHFKYLFNKRVAILIAAIIWILFGLLDRSVVDGTITKLFIIRFIIVLPLILFVFFASFMKSFRRYLQFFISFGILTGGLGLIAIRSFSNIEVYANTLHVGLILILYYGYAVMRARFIWASISGILILISYEFVSIFIINLPLKNLLYNSVYLLSASTIGMFTSYCIEYYSRKEFYNLHLIEEEKNKTAEMNKQLSIEVSERIKAENTLKEYLDNLENIILERTKEIRETQQEIIYRLGIASEYKDKNTGKHIQRLGHYCFLLAKETGLEEEECDLLFHASQMHDVGKIGIPDAILLKAGKLNEEELKIMQTHPLIGETILKGNKSPILRMARIIALTHHEKWDGSGYPHKLKGKEIPLIGQIACLCDIFDAMMSKRSYKDRWPIEKVLREMDKLNGSVFNNELYAKFKKLVPDFIEIFEKYHK